MKDIQFSVPTNWQDDLIPGLPTHAVSEIYGKLDADFIGGGRASAILHSVSRKKAARHIKQAHTYGFKFNYLLNGTCLGNWELTKSGQNKIKELIEWVIEAGADSVTVSSPFMMKLIKKSYTLFKVNVSVQENVNTIRKALMWEEIGADKITLSVLDTNRNFSLLKKIRGAVSCRLQLIANLKCLAGCNLYKYHSNINAHASQSQHRLKGYLIDYCTLRCGLIRVQEPVEYIKSMWIRPEDAHYYEALGIDGLKLVGRQMPTFFIHKIAHAYANRSYKGNLLDILSGAKKNIVTGNKQVLSYFRKVKYFLKPYYVNPFYLKEASNLFAEDYVTINNCGLDGFLDYFVEERCDFTCKTGCNYCYDVAKKVLNINTVKQKERIKRIESFLNKLYTGRLFRYLN